MTDLHKTFNAKMTAEPGKRQVVARISTTSVDRDGDVILPSGVDLSDYRKNPVVLFAHDGGSLPVGYATSIFKSPDSLDATVQFAERPKEHPKSAEWLPDTLFSLFRQGVLRAFSVGFLISDARDADEKDVRKFGDGVRRVINKWKLLEFSVVPIPANQDALAVAVSKGLIPTGSLAAAMLPPGPRKILVKVPQRIAVPPRVALVRPIHVSAVG